MNTIAAQIEQLIHATFDVDVTVRLERPDPTFGDYSTNVAMQLAKPLGKNPREIAEKITEELLASGRYEEVTIAGPGFINLRLSAKALHDALSQEWSEKYGESMDGYGKTAVVDFPSQNMAKPYSVGHLRPGNQGWAAVQLLKATGWEVITDNHLGDYGAPFGAWVVGFLRYSSDEKLESDGVYELGRIYIQIKKDLKEEKEFGEHQLADEVQDWLLKLDRQDEEALSYAKRFYEVSIDHIHSVMARLKINTDYEYGESFYVEKGKEAVARLLSEGVAKQNEDGSVIVPIDEYGIDVPVLLQKSNGAPLYATTDLATILFREETWHPDMVVYAVGAEQKFYFTQIFALAKKIGIETDLVHLWFGVIDQQNEDGSREKMSSRKGVVLMEELLDKAEERARELVDGREVSHEDVQKVALGAVKFTDFVADRRTNILFDWERIFALSGMSGPYVQYAAVRVNKILRDNMGERELPNDYDYASEKEVIAKVIEYPEIVRLAAKDLEPHKVATYLYELAREMNRYYEATPIATSQVDESTKSARLDILEKVSHVFMHGLGLLGIEVPTRM